VPAAYRCVHFVSMYQVKRPPAPVPRTCNSVAMPVRRGSEALAVGLRKQ
jgi:hypothetical protein